MPEIAIASGRAQIPVPRGTVSQAIIDLLKSNPQDLPSILSDPSPVNELIDLCDGKIAQATDLFEPDLQLAFYILGELHYRGIESVDDRWSESLAARAIYDRLASWMVEELEKLLGPSDPIDIATLDRQLYAQLAAVEGPSAASYLSTVGTADNYRELLTHRSIYHLREADPHSAALLWLSGPEKAALVEIQADEYGGGRYGDMHAILFATTMKELGLNTSYSHYINSVPAVTLAWANVMTLFASSRRWAGALVGHLLSLELPSSVPNKRYGDGLRRLGFGVTATTFFDEHVEADAVHEQLATYCLALPYLTSYPEQSEALMFGFRAGLTLDALSTTHMVESWTQESSSLINADANINAKANAPGRPGTLVQGLEQHGGAAEVIADVTS